MRNPGSRIFIRFHATVLRLYPPDFRDQFGEEIQAVLLEALEEAAKLGIWAMMVITLRELYDLPRTLIGLYGSGNRREPMETHIDENWKTHNGKPKHIDSTQDGRSSRPETLMGILPFLVFGSLIALGDLASSYKMYWVSIGFIGVFLAYGLFFVFFIGLAWAKDFPRWSFSYVGYAPVMSLLLMGFRISPHRIIGWWALIPISAVALIAILLPRLRRPLTHLVRKVWKDWTLLSFAIYSLLPIPMWMAFDESEYEAPFLILITFLLAIGAITYLRNTDVLRRMGALMISTVLSGMVLTVGTTFYWDGKYEPWMSEPGQWYAILFNGAAGIMLLGILFAPALLGLLHWWITRRDRFSNA